MSVKSYKKMRLQYATCSRILTKSCFQSYNNCEENAIRKMRHVVAYCVVVFSSIVLNPIRVYSSSFSFFFFFFPQSRFPQVTHTHQFTNLHFYFIFLLENSNLTPFDHLIAFLTNWNSRKITKNRFLRDLGLGFLICNFFNWRSIGVNFIGLFA